MDTKALVKILRRWHIFDGLLYCPQCWGQYLAQFDADDIADAKADASDGNTSWARKWPICEMCRRNAGGYNEVHK